MDWEDKFFVAVGGAVILFVIALFGFGAYNATQVQTHSACAVESKDRAQGDGQSDMRLYTSCGIFKVKDDLWTWQWDSADRYHEIEVGQTYDFTTRGLRVGFLSYFPRVIDMEG